MGNAGSAEAAGRRSRQGWRRLEPLVVLTPFLLATFPVVFLAAENTGEDIGAFEVIAPLFVIWAGVAVLALLLRLWLKSTPKAAMAAVIVVVAINTIHNLPQRECRTAVREIQRVSLGHGFIVVDTYRNEAEQRAIEKWLLTARTVISVDGWRSLFAECGYTGDYYWFTAG